MKKQIGAAVVAVGLVAGLSLALANGRFGAGDGSDQAEQAERGATESAVVATSPGASVLEQAAQEGKYVFAVFWRNENEQTATMQQVVSEVVAKVPDRAVTVAVHVTDPAEAALMERFGLHHAPMPLALAIAPNGAVTGGFPVRCDEEDLLGAFASPAAEQTMKALQDGKIVLLCIQNSSTQQNSEALEGVVAFQGDPRFRAATKRVMLDPNDGAEASFLAEMGVDLGAELATTVMLVPPGSRIQSMEGATTKEDFLSALRKAPACGPSGCGSAGCGAH